VPNSSPDNTAVHGQQRSASKPLPYLPPAQWWDAPQSILQNLLQISEQLPIEGGEVTPVQAWACLQQHVSFPQLTAGQLHYMSDELLAHIKCYG
jgi:hypothetical protein